MTLIDLSRNIHLVDDNENFHNKMIDTLIN